MAKHTDTPLTPAHIARIAADLGGPADPARDARIARHVAAHGRPSTVKETPAPAGITGTGAQCPAVTARGCRRDTTALATQGGEET